MLFLLTIIVSVLVGILRGGKISRLGNISVKWWGALVTALAIRLCLHRLAGSGLIGSSAAAALNLTSYALLVVVGALNVERLPGLGWILLGVAANGWVIFVNGGKMLISPSALAVIGLDKTPEYAALLAGASYTHKLATDGAKLAFLGDIIPLRLPFVEPVAASLGDVAICVGGFLLIQWLMLDREVNGGTSSERGDRG